MNVTVDPTLLKQFENPLDFIDPQDRRHYRNRAIRKALVHIGIGICAAMLLTYLDHNNVLEQFTVEHGPRSGVNPIGDPLAIAAILLPIYGMLQLLTLRNRMTDYARSQLTSKYPELEEIEKIRKQKLEASRSNFLKVFTFSFAGIMIALSVIAAIYMSLHG